MTGKCANCQHQVNSHAPTGCVIIHCDCPFEYDLMTRSFNSKMLPVDPAERKSAPGRVVEEEKCSACTIEGVRVARKDCPMHGPKPADARSSQVGGDHYRKYKIQPWDIWQEYGLDAFTGAILKYLLRDKGKRLEDLRKARHTLDRLIEIEEERDGVLRKEAEEAG